MLSRLLSLLMALGLALSLAGSQGTAPAAALPTAATATLSILPSWTFDDPDQEGSGVGYAVNSAGDVNGDGYGDVVIGADKYTVSVDTEGAAFVFYGTSNGLGEQPDWVAGGGLKGHAFGNAVSSAGDVDGDGYGDVLVGAYLYKEKELLLPDEGAAFLFYGSEDGLESEPRWQALGKQRDAQFGYAVSGAGDVNGDGYGDVIIGARFYDSPDNIINEGAAFLDYGSEEGLSAAPDWTAFGGLPAAGFGSAVSSAGDVNNDGYDDVVVGAPNAFVNWGMVSVFFGSESGLQGDADWTATGSSDAYFGRSAASAGDVDGDGCDDVIIGAPGADSGLAQDVGAAYLFQGSTQGLAEQPAWQAAGRQLNERFGAVVDSAGDINQDGLADVLVSAPYHTNNQSLEGVVYSYIGSAAGLSTSPNWWAYGDKAEAYFGLALGGAGDVNGDSLADIIVGTPEFKLETLKVGRAFVYLGYSIKYSYVYLPLVVKAGTE